ncbi:hypothetical protein [Microbacterium sp.]|uniref:hypothetical protein n=1 Tax=Microbacterium sp. TaxID=51671 RepID=UPI003A95270D
MNAQNDHEDRNRTGNSDGWSADDRPIFIDSGFGSIRPSSPRTDGFGEHRRLTPGAVLPADAGEADFARAWTDILSEEPTGVDRWEYSVEMPRGTNTPRTSGPVPLDAALERVRLTPGARLRRRAVGRWNIVRTPFPSVEKPGWADLDQEKNRWHAAMLEFPPSFRGSVSRMGGVDAAPSGWIEFARRAAAAGFTPGDYRMLGTAHLAWTARQAKSQVPRRRDVPALTSIEVWARFPRLVAEGLSPLEAIERIVVQRR